MPSVEELLNQPIEEGYAFSADDADAYCQIDELGRIITLNYKATVLGVEHDKAVERVFFACPRYVGDNVDLDLTQCTVYVNYMNAGGEKDRYIVTDLNVAEDDSSKVTFSWLLSRKVTAVQGDVRFIVCAVKTKTGGEVEQEWNTTIARANVLEGLEPGEYALDQDDMDVVNQLMDMIYAEIQGANQWLEDLHGVEVTSGTEPYGQKTEVWINKKTDPEEYGVMDEQDYKVLEGVANTIKNYIPKDSTDITESISEYADKFFYVTEDERGVIVGDLSGYYLHTVQVAYGYKYYISVNSNIFRIGESSLALNSGVVISGYEKYDGMYAYEYTPSLESIKYLYIMYKIPDNKDVASISIYQEKKEYHPNVIMIAANNSSDADKRNAKYICPGVNDENIIQNVINELATNGGGTCLLLNGDYNIDALSQVGGVTDYSYACSICLREELPQCNIKISGISPCMRKMGEKSPYGTAILHVNSNVFSQISENNFNRSSIIGYFGTVRQYPKYGIEVENIGIEIASNQYPINVVDGYFYSQMRVKNVFITVLTTGDSEDTSGYEIPNDKCVGFVTPQGSAMGTGQRFDGCFVWGLGVGYEINAEHLIMEQCGARFSYIPFRFGANRSVGVNSHDITLINCCDEGCIRGISFASIPYMQSVNLYDYNSEIHKTGNFARQQDSYEENPGDYRGNIYYTCVYVDGAGRNVFRPFFKNDGSGINFNVVNTTVLKSGNISDRPTEGNPRQRYYAIDENKEYIYYNGWHEV